MSTTPLLDVLPESAVADALGCSVKTLRNRRAEQTDHPPYVRLSRSRVVYLRDDVELWLRARRVTGAPALVATGPATASSAASQPAAEKRGRGRPRGAATRRQRGEG